MAKTAGGLKYKDYDAGDGYVYRQYTDDSILILKSPKHGQGTLLREGEPPSPEAWTAINNAIKDMKSGKRREYVKRAAVLASQILASSPQAKSTTKSATKVRKPQPSAPVDLPPPPTPAPLTALATAGIGLLIGVAGFMLLSPPAKKAA